jgi:hypothetical protein
MLLTLRVLRVSRDSMYEKSAKTLSYIGVYEEVI